MAIKVNGTTVIDDSRNLSNVGGIKTIGGTSVLGSGNIEVGDAAASFKQIGSTFTYSGNTTSEIRSGSYTLPATMNSLTGFYFYMKYDFSASGNYGGLKLKIATSSSLLSNSAGWAQYRYATGSATNIEFAVFFLAEPDGAAGLSDPPTSESGFTTTAAGAERFNQTNYSSQYYSGNEYSFITGDTLHFGLTQMQSGVTLSNMSLKLYAKYS
jgi:hypothetical protein